MSTGLRNVSWRAPQRWVALDYVQTWLGALSVRERRWLLVTNDLALVGLASLIVMGLAGQDGNRLAPLMAFQLLVILGVLYSGDQYSLEAYREGVVLRAIVSGVVGAFAACLLLAAPAVVIPPLCLSGCLALLFLLISRPWLEQRLTSQASCRSTLVPLSEQEARAAYDEIRRHPQAGVSPVAQTPLESGDACGLDLTRLYEHLSQRVPVRHIDEHWFIACFSGSRGSFHAHAKRILDVSFACVGLLFALVLWPCIAIAIALGDSGPLLYSQERVGLDGRRFRLYKFRTMRCDAEQHGAVWARPNDERVTRVGRFLRQTRLDELPQLFNVLKGDMSLVGPRPERPEFVQDLERVIPYYQRRHLVLPGVTGWAQVRFPYGGSIADAEEKLKYDLYYLKHRSIVFDLLILLRTVSVVLYKTGAR